MIQLSEGRTVKTITLFLLLIALHINIHGQEFQDEPVEERVPLTRAAVALDGLGQSALSASLLTTNLVGSPDSPVSNIRLVVRNVSPYFYSFTTGVVTFYDPAGVRCGTGIFKADALAVNESIETDTPGIRISCAPATWRLVATNLILRSLPSITPLPAPEEPLSPVNFIISIDGREYPLQLDRPLVLTLGNQSRRIVIRKAP